MTREREIQPFVKIQIASPNANKPKEIRLTRMQFEFLFFTIPVILLWGLASTAILIKTLYIDRPQPTNLPVQSRVRSQDATDVAPQNLNSTPNINTRMHSDNSKRGSLEQAQSIGTVKSEIAAEPTAARAEPVEAEVPTSEAASNETTATVQREKAPLAATTQAAERSFRVEDIFDVDIFVESRSPKAPVSITIAMTNLTKDLDAGRYWLSVLATTKKGQKVWLTPMPEVKIDDQGQAKSPERGHAYSFRNFRKQRLSVSSPRIDVARFEAVSIGFVRTGKPPAIVKTQLIPR